MIQSAERPLLLIASACNRNDSAQALRDFVDRTGIYFFGSSALSVGRILAGAMKDGCVPLDPARSWTWTWTWTWSKAASANQPQRSGAGAHVPPGSWRCEQWDPHQVHVQVQDQDAGAHRVMWDTP